MHAAKRLVESALHGDDVDACGGEFANGVRRHAKILVRRHALLLQRRPSRVNLTHHASSGEPLLAVHCLI